MGDVLELEGRTLHPIDADLAAYKTHVTIHLPEWGDAYGQSAKVFRWESNIFLAGIPL